MMKNGRAGSSPVNVLIHAPPMPKDKSKKGPTQHAEAPIAAKRAPTPSHDGVLIGVSGSVFMKISSTKQCSMLARSLNPVV
jgi:hypothetical protein